MLSAVELSMTRVGFRGEAVGAVVRTNNLLKQYDTHWLICTSLWQLNNNRVSEGMLKGSDNSYSAAV